MKIFNQYNSPKETGAILETCTYLLTSQIKPQEKLGYFLNTHLHLLPCIFSLHFFFIFICNPL